MNKTIDVLCVGNAIMDVFASCDDAFLDAREIGKGMLNLVEAADSAALYADLDQSEEISGGSAANTAVGLALLGGRAAFSGRVHDDALGHAFCRDIAAASVLFNNAPHKTGAPTASSIILVTPDACRSMNTFLGACIEFQPDDILEADAQAAKIIYLEGYLFDAPEGPAIFARAGELAAKFGCKISLSLSDPWCAERHRGALNDFIKNHVDILFANEAEASSLCEVPVEAAIDMLVCDVEELVVTRGANGAFVGTRDLRCETAARPTGDVVDTTGAGDLFAAGYLYGRTNGYDIEASAVIASVAAGEIISHVGARPRADLQKLVSAAWA
jgi:sugar/nucleoside kinase (ribokinase family)